MLFLSLNRNDHKILDKLCENFQVLLRYSYLHVFIVQIC